MFNMRSKMTGTTNLVYRITTKFKFMKNKPKQKNQWTQEIRQRHSYNYVHLWSMLLSNGNDSLVFRNDSIDH